MSWALKMGRELGVGNGAGRALASRGVVCVQEDRALVGIWGKDFTWEEIWRAATITKGLGSQAGFRRCS